MVGDPQKNDKNFTPENYEDFYEHHYFEPLGDDVAFSINEFIPRFGWAFDKIEELEAKSVLDVGCLDGSFALSVARQLGIPVAGVDLTTDGIRIAKERADRLGLDAEFYQGAAEEVLKDFALTHNGVDVVTAFEIIEHVKDVPAFLKAIEGVVRPGGSILLSTPEFEGPIYGLDDEQNTCHVRLYTMADEDYEKENKYGHVRKATSMPKEIGKERIVEMRRVNDQICVHYKKVAK